MFYLFTNPQPLSNKSAPWQVGHPPLIEPKPHPPAPQDKAYYS